MTPAATAPSPSSPLLAVEGLSVSFPGQGRRLPVLRDVSFTVARGEAVGLVGESGAGKSLTALSIVRLLPPGARIDGGAVRLDGEDLLTLPEPDARKVRGGRVGLVFQEPQTALNPVFSIGFQITECLRLHRRLSRREARRRARELLELVAMPDPEERLGAYPHELSGGQRQRVMLSMALACQPDLLLADEPTTALDVTVQAQILELLAALRRRLGLAVLLVTHDLGVVAESCERVVVMYAGEVVEEGEVKELFAAPAHPYTRALLAASRGAGYGDPADRLATIPGRMPEPGSLPDGCPFHPRCLEAMAECRHREVPLIRLGPGRGARCLLHEERLEGSEAGQASPGPGGGVP